MVEKTTGLILRTRPLTETSLIVHWLTPQFGRLATVAKGACRPKSPFRGKLDLFYHADFSFSRSRRSELHALREVSLLDTHAALRRELAYLRQASYCVRLLEQTTETETPLQPMFELFRGFLDWLPGHPPRPENVFAFELKLLSELGLQPDLTQSRLNRDTVGIIQILSGVDWPAIPEANVSAARATEIDQFLHGFLIYHLERLASGRAAAVGQLAANR